MRKTADETHKIVLDNDTQIEVNDDFKEAIITRDVSLECAGLNGKVTTRIRLPFWAIQKILKIKVDNG